MFLLPLFLLAASTRVGISDEICEVPAGEWRYREVELHQDPARVSATYEVQSGSRRVRLALMRSEELDRMRQNLPYGVVEVTEEGSHGMLVDRFRRRGDFAIVVDNQDGHEEAKVHLRIWADFGSGHIPEVTELSKTRKLTVIFLSLAVFCGIATYSGRKLWRITRT